MSGASQMSVLELYDASKHDLRVLDLAFEETSLPISSWEVVPLEVRAGQDGGWWKGRQGGRNGGAGGDRRTYKAHL